MPAIQPWSAAGAEKPMVTLSPLLSLSLAALLPPPELALSGVLLVQPVIRAPAAIRPTAVGIKRRKRRCRAADMPSPRRVRGPPGGRPTFAGGPDGPPGGAVRGWERVPPSSCHRRRGRPVRRGRGRGVPDPRG